jgi:hypothetical protein
VSVQVVDDVDLFDLCREVVRVHAIRFDGLGQLRELLACETRGLAIRDRTVCRSLSVETPPAA